MRPDDRHERIVALVRERERVSVEALSGDLQASRETIRRDLTELDRLGRLRKVHGGAVLPDPALLESAREGPFQSRLVENVAAKRMIARRAVRLFQPGETLFVDTGSTTLLFAEELAHADGLTVVTNSAAIAALAARGRDSRVFLVGGAYRSDAGQNVGPLAVEQIGRFHADHAVLTVGAASAVGFLDYDLDEADVARAMLRQAKSATVLADASKFERSGLFKVATFDAVARLVTDRSPPAPLTEALVGAGVEIVLAG